MRNVNRVDLKWVRGNDVLLRALLYEPQTDSTGEAVVDRKGNPKWIPMDLESYDDISANLKLMGDTTVNSKKGCGCNESSDTTSAYYSVAFHKGSENGLLIIDIPGTLPTGTYSLEITGHKNGRAMRAFENRLFEIVECNGRANVTFDLQEGQKSADVDIKVQLSSSAIVQGKNAYELWRELPGNENKTLQEYLDGIGTGMVYQSDWNVEDANSPAYIKNRPDVYTKREVDTRINNVSNNAGYQKPASGIPYSDLSSSVQLSLNKANSALQNLSGYTASDVNALPANTKFQSGTEFTTASNNKVTFKTINGNSIVGSGNITVEGGDSVSTINKLYYMYNNRGTYGLYDETGQAPSFDDLRASNSYCGYLTFNDRMYRLSTMTSDVLKYDYLNLDPETHILTKETFTITKTNGISIDYSIAYNTYGIEIPLMTFDSGTQTLNINGQGGSSGSGTVTGIYTVRIITTPGASLTEPVVSESSTFTTTVNAGTSMALKFNVGTGYHIASLLVNGSNKTSDIANNVYRLNNITEDIDVNFNCEVDATAGQIFTITIDPGTGGSFTYNGTQQVITETRISVESGSSFTVTATPEDGYTYGSTSVSGNYTSRTDDGNTVSIMGVKGNISVTANFVVNYDYIEPSIYSNTYGINAIDLGLPSGVLWGDRNLGAASLTDEGEYYGWGDPTGEETSINNNAYAPNNTNICISATGYDIVKAKLGGCWRLPTFEDYVELYKYTQNSYSQGYGDKGYGAYKLEANNNSIYFIIAGYKRTTNNTVYYAGNDTWMWTGDAIDSNTSLDIHYVGPCTSNLEYDVVRYLVMGSRSQKAVHLPIRPVWDPNYVPKADKPVINANGKDYVDLGLYHGRLWATMNVGASAPEEYGNYYAWGETTTKVDYSFDTYEYKVEGATDRYQGTSYQNLGSDISGTQYDAAKLEWGGDWRMPTVSELSELLNRCTWTTSEQNGVTGSIVTGPNGRSIFIPYSGYRNNTTLYFDNNYPRTPHISRLWSGTLGWSKPYNVNGWANVAASISTDTPQGIKEQYFGGQYDRVFGHVIRPVIGKEAGALPAYVFMPDDDEAVDLGLPSGTLWAQHDLGGSNYYSWGEIEPKDFYSFYNYGHRVASATSSTTDASYIHIGFNIADSNYDAVKVKWANGWTMPTEEQMQELIDECEWTWSNDTIVITSKQPNNNNSITIHADGYMRSWQHVDERYIVAYWVDAEGHYEINDNSYPEKTKGMCLKVTYQNNDSIMEPKIEGEYKYLGMKIRPVKVIQEVEK